MQKHGQAALEFLYATGVAMLVFTMALMVYYQSQGEASALFAYVDSQRICHAIASQISAVDSAGAGTIAPLELPGSLAYSDYNIYVSGKDRSLSIQYGSQDTSQGTSCLFSSSNISSNTSNGSASSFYIKNGSTTMGTISNEDGGLVVS